MKVTTELLRRLNNLKGKKCALISGQYFFDRRVNIVQVIGWKIEDVEVKISFFGKGTKTEQRLREIHMKSSEDIGTKYYSLYTNDLANRMEWLEHGLRYMISIEQQLNKFGSLD